MTDLQYVACVWSSGSDKEGVLYVFYHFRNYTVVFVVMSTGSATCLSEYRNGPHRGILVLLTPIVTEGLSSVQ